MKTRLYPIGLAVVMLLTLIMAACSGDQAGQNPETPGVPQNEQQNGNEQPVGSQEPQTRFIEHAMGRTEVPANPQRIVVLTGDALEAVLSVGMKPVGSAQAQGDRIWYEHLESYMDGVENVGAMTAVDLEKIFMLQPDLILGAKSRQEAAYPLLSEIAPTVFTESHTLGQWKEDFFLYLDAANKLEEGKAVMAAWEARAAELSAKLEAAGKLEQEVGIVRFTAGQGRFFYNMSYSGSIVKELGFKRPANHDVDDKWVENITQERIPEMDADIIFYFVLDNGDGKAIEFADEWIQSALFQNLRASKNGQVHQVEDGYWNMTYGMLSADYVLADIERHMLGGGS